MTLKFKITKKINVRVTHELNNQIEVYIGIVRQLWVFKRFNLEE